MGGTSSTPDTRTTSETHPHSSRLGKASLTTTSLCECSALYFPFSVEGGLASSQFGAMTNGTAINVPHKPFCGFVDSRLLTLPQTAVGSHKLSFTRNFHTVIPSSAAYYCTLPADNVPMYRSHTAANVPRREALGKSHSGRSWKSFTAPMKDVASHHLTSH